MLIGNKIYELRKRENISQEQLAERINVTRETISNWETNQTVPDLNWWAMKNLHMIIMLTRYGKIQLK